MAQNEVKNVMIELKSGDNDNVRIRVDNPVTNITREMISSAFQPALINEWIITSKGSKAIGIGEVVLETSIKIPLVGEDYYITPSSLSISGNKGTSNGTVTISGATIQGYNFKNKRGTNWSISNTTISENGLSITVTLSKEENTSGSFDLVIVVQGTEVTIPCTIS